MKPAAVIRAVTRAGFGAGLACLAAGSPVWIALTVAAAFCGGAVAAYHWDIPARARNRALVVLGRLLITAQRLTRRPKTGTDVARSRAPR
jgi:hypothetical protein